MRWRAPRSLLGQFALLHVMTGLVAAATLPIGVSALLHRVAHHYQHEVLGQQGARLATLLTQESPAQAVAQVDLIAGGLSLVVVDAARRPLAARGPARPDTLAHIPLDARARRFRRGQIAAISRPVGRYWIIVAQDGAAPEVVTDDIVTTFLKRFVLLLIPLILLVALPGVWLMRRLTRRMRAASEIAAAIGPRTLDRRLPRDTLPAEVEPLAVATNAVLDRLERAFAVQAAFAADVAHELRTPLATIGLRADAVADAGVRASLLAEVDRAARVIEQLLGLADLERPMEEACAPVDLALLGETVVAERAPMVLAAGYGIALQVEEAVTVRGYAGAIELALTNLVDNAVRHTPRGTTITVEVGPGATVAVADDGPPLDPARIARMTARFWRGEARAGGSGLGLSIVARIAAAHGGALALTAGDGGRGLRAQLTLGAVDGA